MGTYKKLVDKAPRLSLWWSLTILLGALVYYLSPQQFPIILYKMSLVSLASIVAYWIDRSLFKFAWPKIDEYMQRDMVTSARVLARSFVYLGTVLGITLGL